MYFIDYIFTNR